MKNFDEKMTYLFEGSGAPEAKLKPRDSMEELLIKFKETAVAITEKKSEPDPK